MKKQMTSVLSLVLAAAMLFSLAGCASFDETGPTSSEPAVSQETSSQKIPQIESSESVSSEVISSEPVSSGAASSEVSKTESVSSVEEVSSAPVSSAPPAPPAASSNPASQPPVTVSSQPAAASGMAPAVKETTAPVVPVAPGDKVIGNTGMTYPEIMAYMRRLFEDAGFVYDENLTEDQSEYTGEQDIWVFSSTQEFKDWAVSCVPFILDDAAMSAEVASEYSETLYFKLILKVNPKYAGPQNPDDQVLRILWKPGAPDPTDNRSAYTRPYDFETIKADMIAYGEELGMRYDPSLRKEDSGYNPGTKTCFSDDAVSLKTGLRNQVKRTMENCVRETGKDPTKLKFCPYVQKDEWTPGEYVIFVLYR